jgi:transcriptional regulator with XRE-family HTH domain
MDLEPYLTSDFSPDFPEGRVKSSLRLQYEAQVRVIQGQIGSLEKIRSDLGLSQRKISQLLLVDPSAWTRWTRDEMAPPHVWRALQWYMTLKEKIPGLTPQYFLGSDPKVLNERTLKKLEDERHHREQTISALTRRLAELEKDASRIQDFEAQNRKLAALQRDTVRLRRWNLFWSSASFILLAAAVALLLR